MKTPPIIAERTTAATDARDAQRASWRYRAVEATCGHLTPLGCILLAVLGQGRDKLPCLGLTCTISKRGDVLSDLFTIQGRYYPQARVCSVEDLIGGFRGLSDALAFPDADREALFLELRRWVALDHRPLATESHKENV